jgi:hypothetical protein
MSKARICVGCGCKYYPNSYSACPQTEYEFNYETREHTRHEVEPSHKRFHSQSCMKSWVAKNSQAFSELVDNITIYDNTITNQTHRKE